MTLLGNFLLGSIATSSLYEVALPPDNPFTSTDFVREFKSKFPSVPFNHRILKDNFLLFEVDLEVLKSSTEYEAFVDEYQDYDYLPSLSMFNLGNGPLSDLIWYLSGEQVQESFSGEHVVDSIERATKPGTLNLNDLVRIADQYGVDIRGYGGGGSYNPPNTTMYPMNDRIVDISDGYIDYSDPESPLASQLIDTFFHELGHALSGPEFNNDDLFNGTLSLSPEERDAEIMKAEMEAWRIGQAIAKQNGTVLDESVIQTCLDSYSSQLLGPTHPLNSDESALTDTIQDIGNTPADYGKDNIQEWYDEQGGYYQGASLRSIKKRLPQ